MLSRPQQILLKRAQAQAGVDDAEYRDTLECLCGVRSSTDPRMSDEQLDIMLAYLEAIYWRGVRSGVLQPPCKGNEVLAKEGFWALRNRRGNTSRDRFTHSSLTIAIESLEADLAALGYGPEYCAAIKQKVTHGENSVRAMHHYRAALTRTICGKRKVRVTQPF